MTCYNITGYDTGWVGEQKSPVCGANGAIRINYKKLPLTRNTQLNIKKIISINFWSHPKRLYLYLS